MEEYITVHNTTLKEAEKKRLPIDACLILKRKENSGSVRYIQFEGEKCVIANCDAYLQDCTEKYNIQQVKSTDDIRIAELLENGFRFHDRILRVEIFLKDNSGSFLNDIDIPVRGGEISISLSDEYTEEMYRLACEAYTTDRRFHLEQRFDQNVANHVIASYLKEFNEKNYPVIKAVHRQELLGFTVIREDRDKNCFENILGATLPGMKGKMAAVPLYKSMLQLGSESAFENKYRRYVGDISSANVASINLHMQLGAKVVDTIDAYIYRN